jgi:hypothetical protein
MFGALWRFVFVGRGDAAVSSVGVTVGAQAVPGAWLCADGQAILLWVDMADIRLVLDGLQSLHEWRTLCTRQVL